MMKKDHRRVNIVNIYKKRPCKYNENELEIHS